MQFSKLRLVGFKSFVEPTEFDILPGLTGVIGPNGCGKSNLVEALRWVMGESSFKSMRGSGMDDVIFAGAGQRPARNVAEVGLTLDNASRTAPAAFNDDDVLVVTRHIERERGSTYRINGREVRARDVQILFADAATGSRSPSMVRQGQIAEIIAAKPQARRRILEEAAGIAGLHSRRHEAELRLKAAEDNLTRIDDLLAEIGSRGDELRKQARQAKRFREIQAEIRRLQAFAALIDFETAEHERDAARDALGAATAAVVAATAAQGGAARAQAEAAFAMPTLRERENEASAALQRHLVAREALDGEEKRAKRRLGELEQRIKELRHDAERDVRGAEDIRLAIQRLEAERQELAAVSADQPALEALRTKTEAAERDRKSCEEQLSAKQGIKAGAEAQRAATLGKLRDERNAVAKALSRLQEAEREHAALQTTPERRSALEDATEQLRLADEAIELASGAAERASKVLGETRARDDAARSALISQERVLHRLETEIKTLDKLLAPIAAAAWPPIMSALVVAKGFEQALVAALGDELEASIDERSPARWSAVGIRGTTALPAGLDTLDRHVEAPAALVPRLEQIGIVARGSGAALQGSLAPGQRLVSLEGDLWRWDGFSQRADASSPAARRLVERNRLADLNEELGDVRRMHGDLEHQAEAARSALRQATEEEAGARAAMARAQRAATGARDHHRAIEKQQNEADAKIARSEASVSAAKEAHDDFLLRLQTIEAEATALPDLEGVVRAFEAARQRCEAARLHEAGSNADLKIALRQREDRSRRVETIASDLVAWQQRAEELDRRQSTLAQRQSQAEAEYAAALDEPDRFILARRRLLDAIALAEAELSAARDRRAAGEKALTESDRTAKSALDDLAATREAKVRSEAQLEAANRKLEELVQEVSTELGCVPTALPSMAGLKPGDVRPALATVAAKLEGARDERDRLGAVNLRADDELGAAEAQRSELDREKTDLTAAIRRLRQAIGSLNKEGRDRLLEAFGRVNGHFGSLFGTLFGGGTAELQLIESDDPLEAGLEIVARPPGKRPQVMTLLSGGEQALTAISLIFAVFLTNPSPICVLDEVDAPLDDANVERFCELLDAMRSRTQTRFLAITHNPITMARMDRLCGVTQAERGISQLVTVDLLEATQLVERDAAQSA